MPGAEEQSKYLFSEEECPNADHPEEVFGPGYGCGLCGFERREESYEEATEHLKAKLAGLYQKGVDSAIQNEERMQKLQVLTAATPNSVDDWINGLVQWMAYGGTLSDLTAATARLDGVDWKRKYEEALERIEELKRGRG
jgi:hypothetical protein